MVDKFCENFSHYVKDKKIPERQLCADLGLSPSYFNRYLSGEAKWLPPHDIVEDVAKLLGVSPFDLTAGSGRLSVTSDVDLEAISIAEAQKFARDVAGITQMLLSNEPHPSSRDIVNWLRSTDGRLDESHRLYNYIDVYELVDASDTMLKPIRIAPNGLAAKHLGTEDPQHLCKMMQSMNAKALLSIMNKHITARDASEPQTKFESLDVKVPAIGVRVTQDYFALRDKARLINNKPISICFTEPILPK